MSRREYIVEARAPGGVRTTLWADCFPRCDGGFADCLRNKGDIFWRCNHVHDRVKLATECARLEIEWRLTA